MAGSASNAYMMFRQFSPGVQRTQGANLDGYRAATISGPNTSLQGPSVGTQLTNFASAASELWGAYSTNQEVQKQAATAKVEDWMSQHTIEEYRQKMRENNTPFQDDPVSLSVLHNKAAYTVALQVEEKMQAKIAGGEFKTVEEADKARTEALNGARAEYALSMGISPEDPAFVGGFDRDQEKRRQLMISLQTDQTSKTLAAQAKVIAKSDMLAPLTPAIVERQDPTFIANYVQSTVDNAEKLGQIRSDQDKLDMYTTAINHLTGQVGGGRSIEAIGNLKVSIGGQEVTLRDTFGGGVFDQAKLKAINLEQQQDAKRQGSFEATMYDLGSKNDISGLINLRNNLVATSGGKITDEITKLDKQIIHTKGKIDLENAQAQQQLAKAQEQEGRISTAVNTLRGVLDGSLTAVSNRATDMGLQDEAEARKAEARLLDGFPEGPQRYAAMVRLAAFRPDGYADSALKGMNTMATAAFSQYKNKVARGEQAELPKQVSEMLSLYQQDPVSFTGALKAPEYIKTMDAGRQLGMSPEDVVKSQVAFSKLSKDQQKELNDNLKKSLGRIGIKDTQYGRDALKNLAGHYLTLDVDPETAVQMARQDFEKQHTTYQETPIHNSFFAITGEPNSIDKGKWTFENTMANYHKQLKSTPDTTSMMYDPDKQIVRLVNLKTGESLAVGRSDLRNAYVKYAGEAKKAAAVNLNEVMKAENAKNKARQAAPLGDLVFPQ